MDETLVLYSSVGFASFHLGQITPKRVNLLNFLQLVPLLGLLSETQPNFPNLLRTNMGRLRRNPPCRYFVLKFFLDFLKPAGPSSARWLGAFATA